MKVHFMYDCHAFACVGNALTDSRHAMMVRARDLFAEDGCGSLFARAADGGVKPLHGKPLESGRYGVTDAELTAFFDAVDERVNWLARG